MRYFKNLVHQNKLRSAFQTIGLHYINLMRRNYLFSNKYFLISLIFCLSNLNIYAEKKNLCETFGYLVSASGDSFNGYIGELISTDKTWGSVYTSKLEILDAKSTVITQNATGFKKFEIKYGEFVKKEEAEKLAKELETKFSTCFPAFYFEKRTLMFGGDSYHFVQRGDAGLRYFNAYISIFYDTNKTGKYLLSIVFPQSENKLNGNQNSVFKDFVYIKNDIINNQFRTDLLKIIQLSTTNFESLIGSELNDNVTLQPKYSSNQKFVSFEDCFIQNELLDYFSFNIVCAKNMELEKIKTLYSEYFAKISSALGREYAYTMSNNGKTVEFVYRNKLQFSIVKLDVINSGLKFDLYIKVYNK